MDINIDTIKTEIENILDRVIAAGIFHPDQKEQVMEVILSQKNTLTSSISKEQSVFLEALMLDYRMLQMPEAAEANIDYIDNLRANYYDFDYFSEFDFSPIEQY